MKFQWGDIVRVIGIDGPRMVVWQTAGNGAVGCVWFDKRHQVATREWAEDFLEKVPVPHPYRDEV